MQRKYIIGLVVLCSIVCLAGGFLLGKGTLIKRESPVLSDTVKSIQDNVIAIFSDQDQLFSFDGDENSDIGVSQISKVGGTAFIIDTKGYILTNKHVLEEKSSYFVVFDDGTHAKIDKIWFHPTEDLAIAHIETKKRLSSLLIANTTKDIGDSVFTLGTPFSQYINTLSVGVISATNRTLNVDGGKSYTGLYQLDMEINPGNSGGPLLDMDGQVIGIVTAKTIQSNHLGFAIPLSDSIVSQFLMNIKSNSITPIQL